MALFRSLGARKDAVRGTTALEVRKGLANLFTGAGVLPGATSPLVTGTAGWAYSVGKAGFVSTRGASDGVHLFGNDGTVTIGTTGVGSTVPAAPGAGLSRIDIIWVQQPSASENSDTVSDATFGVASGDPNAIPIAPSIPTGALELARNTMAGGAGTTSTASAGNAITQTAARARIAGAVSRIGVKRMTADSGSIGAGELGFVFADAATTTGSVRFTVSGTIEGMVPTDLFSLRVRDGSASGPVLSLAYFEIPSRKNATVNVVDYATLSVGPHTLWVTFQRIAGTGTIKAYSGFHMLVDEDAS